MDSFALRAANAVAGNDVEAAGLEWALGDGSITFEQDAAFAFGGAKATATLGDRVVAPCTTFYARAGDTLSFAQISGGRFLYVAINGGIDVPTILGSRSTYLPGRFGIRSEVNVYHTGTDAEVTGPPHQEEIEALLAR